ncbi:MAG: thioesterase family protein [Solirubrobacterales bacterium]|nr:thioesterase family protein [Solirubrobacterales bacterium]
MADLPTALYERDGVRWLPTDLTRGPWDPDFQHAGPPAALLCRELEAASAIEGGQTVRLSYDILRPVPVSPLRISARVLRPGRRVELVEATLAMEEGPPVMRATSWRMRSDAVPAGSGSPDPGSASPDPPPAPPESGRPGSFGFWKAEVAYHRALDWRFIEGDFEVPGPATVWTRLRVALVEGEPATPLQRLLVMADAASGVSSVLDWSTFTFVNVDLGIHLLRPPEGEWMAMAAVTRLGDTGAALCTSELSDSRGRVGSSTQSLLVAARA